MLVETVSLSSVVKLLDMTLWTESNKKKNRMRSSAVGGRLFGTPRAMHRKKPSVDMSVLNARNSGPRYAKTINLIKTRSQGRRFLST